MMYNWQFTQCRPAGTKWEVIITPYKIKRKWYLLRSCLIGVRGTLHFLVEQVVHGKVWSMYNAVMGREEGREHFF